MEEALCSLCRSPVKVEKESLCEQCSQMEQQIAYLIANHTQTVRKYLGEKFNETADKKTRDSDRRVNMYHPPSGKHTPDRRKKNRRLEEAYDNPKKRNSDI